MSQISGAREVDPSVEAWRLAGERMRQGEPLPEHPPAAEAPPVLSHDEIRALLAHTSLVIHPGEMLVLRVQHWTPAQMREYQEALDAASRHLGWPRVMLVTGEEMGVARAPGDAGSDGSADYSEAAR